MKILCVFTTVWWICSYLFPQLILITACEVDILFSLDTKGNKNVRCQEIHPRSRSFKWGKARFWYCLFDSQANVFHHWDHHFSILQNSLCMICKEIKGRRKWGEGEEKKTNLTFNESSTTWLLTFGIPVCYIVHTSVWYVYFHCQWNCFVYTYLWNTI